MGNSIRDAMTGTPRLVTDRDIVTRVVAAGKEDGRLVGILAQAAVAREGEDSKTGRLVEEISN